jgi:hypothetical protein
VNLIYAIDTRAQLVRLEYRESTTFEEWARVFEAGLRDPAHKPGFNVLLDRRRVNEVLPTVYIQRAVDFIDRHAEMLGRCRMALVVGSQAMYGVGRMAETLCEGTCVTFKVFTEYEEARRWLGGRGLATDH